MKMCLCCGSTLRRSNANTVSFWCPMCSARFGYSSRKGKEILRRWYSGGGSVMKPIPKRCLFVAASEGVEELLTKNLNSLALSVDLQDKVGKRKI